MIETLKLLAFVVFVMISEAHSRVRSKYSQAQSKQKHGCTCKPRFQRDARQHTPALQSENQKRLPSSDQIISVTHSCVYIQGRNMAPIAICSANENFDQHVPLRDTTARPCLPLQFILLIRLSDQHAPVYAIKAEHMTPIAIRSSDQNFGKLLRADGTFIRP